MPILLWLVAAAGCLVIVLVVVIAIMIGLFGREDESFWAMIRKELSD